AHFAPIAAMMRIGALQKEVRSDDGPRLRLVHECQADDSSAVTEAHENPAESTAVSHRSGAVAYPLSQAKGNARRRRWHRRRSKGAATATVFHRVARSIFSLK